MKLNSAVAAALLATGVYADDASKVDNTKASSSAGVEVPTFTVSTIYPQCMIHSVQLAMSSISICIYMYN